MVMGDKFFSPRRSQGERLICGKASRVKVANLNFLHEKSEVLKYIKVSVKNQEYTVF